MAVSNKQLMAIKKLGYSDAEIQQMLMDDKAVDRGQTMEWDLSPEEHKKAMKYANSDEKKKKTAENGDFCAENVEITNKERQIAFVVGENAFELTLVQKRKPK